MLNGFIMVVKHNFGAGVPSNLAISREIMSLTDLLAHIAQSLERDVQSISVDFISSDEAKMIVQEPYPYILGIEMLAKQIKILIRAVQNFYSHIGAANTIARLESNVAENDLISLRIVIHNIYHTVVNYVSLFNSTLPVIEIFQFPMDVPAALYYIHRAGGKTWAEVRDDNSAAFYIEFPRYQEEQ
jgi:hypothetical protein